MCFNCPSNGLQTYIVDVLTIKSAVKFSQKNIGNSREMKSFSIIMIKVIFG